DRDLAYLWKSPDDGFKLLCRNILAVATHHVFAAAHDAIVTLVLLDEQVAGAEPAVTEHSGSCFGILVVAQHQPRTAYTELPHLAVSDCLAIGVADSHLAESCGDTTRTGRVVGRTDVARHIQSATNLG